MVRTYKSPCLIHTWVIKKERSLVGGCAREGGWQGGGLMVVSALGVSDGPELADPEQCPQAWLLFMSSDVVYLCKNHSQKIEDFQKKRAHNERINIGDQRVCM